MLEVLLQALSLNDACAQPLGWDDDDECAKLTSINRQRNAHTDKNYTRESYIALYGLNPWKCPCGFHQGFGASQLYSYTCNPGLSEITKKECRA